MAYSEIRDGVTWITCNCWDCDYMEDGQQTGGMEYTIREYRIHQRERRQAFLAWEKQKLLFKEAAKHDATEGDTEAVGEDIGHLPPTVPTFFDIDTGSLVDPMDKRAYRWKLKRLSIQ